MGILEVLKLPTPAHLAAARPAVLPKDVGKTKEEVEKAWQDVLAFASQIGDRDVKVALAQALKGCDAKRKSAAAAADPSRQDALLKEALADIKSAREAAKKRSEDIPRQLALKHRPALEKLFQQSYDRFEKLTARIAAGKRAAAVAKGDRKAQIEAEVSKLEKQVGEAEHHRDQASTDLEALGNPETTRKELDNIIARRDANANVSRHVDVDSHDDDFHLPGEKHVTTTTTSVEKGTSKSDKTEVERKFGLGSVTQKTSREQELTQGDTTVRKSKESETKAPR